MKKGSILLCGLVVGLATTLWAQHDEQHYVPDSDPLVRQKLQKWQDLKFGLLMHWGAYSQWGIVESWSICSEDEGWCGRNLDDYTAYKARYEALKTTFNPTQFDPGKWARAARKAGMKYVVFTTKHHDGFCMFDSKLTDYKVTDPGCPFHRHQRANIAKEVFDAFRAEGLWTGAYFSKPDWHCPYYWWPNFATPDRNVNYDPDAYPERWEKFIEFTHGQILELMSDYGPMDILWLDGGWVAKKSPEQIRQAYESRLNDSPSGFVKARVVNQDIRMGELVAKARAKQPGLIVVDRAVPGPYQNYLTPENRVPDKTLPFPWESCIIAGGGWSWVHNARYNSPTQVIGTLVDIVSKGGNLLLNIAPDPNGLWDPGAYELLEQVGDWIEVNGEAIYATQPIEPYKEGRVCLTRKKDGTFYAIYLAEEGQTRPPAEIALSTLQPSDNATLVMLGTGTELAWKKAGEGFRVTIPAAVRDNPPCRHAWVIRVSSLKK
jgi:alpha-L-fucosidase